MSVAIRKGTPTGVSSGYGKGIRILAARSRSVVAALTAVKGCHSVRIHACHKKKDTIGVLFLMARPGGFEPSTYRFVAGHSIR